MTAQLTRRDIFRYSAVGLGSLALAGIAAGCAPGGAGTTAPSASSGPVKATNFDFVSWGMSEEATKPALGASVNAFAKKDGITIETPSYPFNDYLNQLTLQVRGGQFAGAAQLDVAWLSSLAALGKLTDLGAKAEGRGYTDAALVAGQFDGAQLGLPWTIAAIGPITNTELFEKAGVSNAPATIEEFEESLRAVKGLGGGVIPYAASTKTAQLKDIIVWMQTFGSPIVEDGKVTIGDAESIAAVTWYKKLFDEGLIAADIDRAAARALFGQGRTAIYDDAPAGRAGVLKSASDPDLAAKMSPVARPVLKAGDTSQELLWGHLVVVVDGEGAGTAADFAQWLTSDPAQQISYFTALGLPPTTTEALESSAVTGNTFVNDFTTRITKDAKASPLWQYVQYAQMETAIAEQVQAVLVGSAAPKAAMKAAGEQVQALIG
ncbi:extracellular solute-binding protein [Microbacterium allomyrinae]|uniref:Extracellular solute-binding protein n=1 Tax=Microbacterium allomyrinae TaxID=2830666 RepID=A0A9X1S470_9MICO|nr:extracellular solute-binding protein [Microbacterium allomyrinae]MCC2032760.1 extracellular solute-binding protein [Microbacterium allomyrinae]